MSKAAFIELVAGLDKKDVLSKADAKRQVERVLGAIEAGLKAGKDKGYTIGGFGTFKVGKRAARKGRNPRTGEAIKIKASKTLRFKPAAALKKAVGA
jgi:DNA-binding protein HU-beta